MSEYDFTQIPSKLIDLPLEKSEKEKEVEKAADVLRKAKKDLRVAEAKEFIKAKDQKLTEGMAKAQSVVATEAQQDAVIIAEGAYQSALISLNLVSEGLMTMRQLAKMTEGDQG